ncbi:hypothetical protein JM658_06495 [Joostella atrarenae]|uniref:Lipoprotein n=1 Tax=Joostella atrarenae TaxID=679257 RepID=A0ABS9J296_9FLAO|nr:hypothetical protein [Joostella atrarenae]MCF8714478.1 hypothetical protein [Joostella atrarenae]
MKQNTSIYIFFIIFCFAFSSCKLEVKEKDNYEIISEVLNHSLGHRSDDENGLGWIDESQEYQSLLVLNHTNLRESDIEDIKGYLTFHELSEFSTDDFRAKQKWDITKIKNFDRYELQVLRDQDVKSPHIGMIQISSISYNEKYDEAIVYTSFICAGSGDCGEGLIFHLQKNKKWTIEKVDVLWVS